MGNCCYLCGSKSADANSTTTSSTISSLSSSSSTPGISECNTSSWVTSRTSGYSQLSGAIKTPNGKSSSGGYSQFTRVRTGDSDICVKGAIFPVSNLKTYSFGDMKAREQLTISDLVTRNQHSLVKWVKSMDLSQKGKLKSIMDPRMEGQYCTKAALQVAQLALRCLENEPWKRPSMNEVVQILEEIEAMGNQQT